MEASGQNQEVQEGELTMVQKYKKEPGPQSSLIEIPEGDMIPEQRRGIVRFV